MKEFRKNDQGFFICEECKQTYNNKIHLAKHNIKFHYQNMKQYFDKWIKDKNDDKCKICGGKTILERTDFGYKKCCSTKCSNELRKRTCLQTYGFITPKLDKRVNRKYKKTCLKKFGVENAMHNIELFDKMQKTSRLKKQFRNTNIWYQGSYELNFLENYYDKYPDIKRAPTIKYKFNNGNKIYYPDFYIPSLKLIIEIKSTYWLKQHKNIIGIKKKATIANGFKYIMIIDKNYENFNNL